MTTGPFEQRTVYSFRQRVSQRMQETRENLVDQVFVQVTDQQLAALELKTGQQRMDSVQVASNIRQMSPLHLLVEEVQRVWRKLSEPDQAVYAGLFEPRRLGTAGQYCYRVRNDQVPGHLEEIGYLMHRLAGELEACCADQPAYQGLQRVFDEHCVLMEGTDEGPGGEQVRAKAGEELSASSCNRSMTGKRPTARSRGRDIWATWPT